ncbi:hypothetical protein M422DRAFT_54748 [Sphaerobolus stellatus SS14]|uniref:Uncharacterized protein n=1 Tax=Sphaerobolus stellatus (strain SS14) TaxID=990650 RepID=A0A0C9US01_SPHS4|nr:hypothetical protein M422DRAFT_54748 [Sphaerobolus stellatus SS14]
MSSNNVSNSGHPPRPTIPRATAEARGSGNTSSAVSVAASTSSLSTVTVTIDTAELASAPTQIFRRPNTLTHARGPDSGRNMSPPTFARPQADNVSGSDRNNVVPTTTSVSFRNPEENSTGHLPQTVSCRPHPFPPPPHPSPRQHAVQYPPPRNINPNMHYQYMHSYQTPLQAPVPIHARGGTRTLLDHLYGRPDSVEEESLRELIIYATQSQSGEKVADPYLPRTLYMPTSPARHSTPPQTIRLPDGRVWSLCTHTEFLAPRLCAHHHLCMMQRQRIVHRIMLGMSELPAQTMSPTYTHYGYNPIQGHSRESVHDVRALQQVTLPSGSQVTAEDVSREELPNFAENSTSRRRKRRESGPEENVAKRRHHE